jgi:lysosomal Pro-X carboxypeptidase
MKTLMAFIAVALAATSVAAIRLVDPVVLKSQSKAVAGNCGPGRTCTEDYIHHLPMEHFSDTGTQIGFKLRILYNNQWYQKGGPVFFYTGNEGPLEGFAQNTGIMWDLAKQFNAFVVFAEHRFYGNTMPGPPKQYLHDAKYLGFLTVEQALADYAAIIPQIYSNYSIDPSSKLIAFGGSYGGMLSAWFRLRYPDIVHGAWAASAPVEYFANNNVPLGAFDAKTKETFVSSGCDADTIVKAVNNIDSLAAKKPTGYTQLNSIFHVDSRAPVNSPATVLQLKNTISLAFSYMAMTDYPYAAGFLHNMTAWPVKQACDYFANGVTANNGLLRSLSRAIQVFYGNTTQTPLCIDSSKCGDQSGLGGTDGNADQGWNWQECTEIAIYQCSQGPPNDFWWKQCTDNTSDTSAQSFSKYSQASCQSMLSNVKGYNASTMWERDHVSITYGFGFHGATNIIFTNGHLDPWSVGGVTATTHGFEDAQKRNIFIYHIDGAAHHLDLRTPNTCDPASVTAARYQIVGILQCWLGMAPAGTNCDPSALQWALPSYTGSFVNNVTCADWNNAYPWGQTGGVGGGSTGSTMAPAGNMTTAAPNGTQTATKGASTMALSSALVLFSAFLSLPLRQ